MSATQGTPQIWGCDFTSAPSRSKPITLAVGEVVTGGVRLQHLLTFSTLAAWATQLQQPGPWVGGFDLPFGLPRPLVEALAWPSDWAACMDHYASLDRNTLRQRFAAFCDARPVGAKFAHRATDGPAGSSPSMKWVNPPVAFMMHAGVPLLRAAGACLPGLAAGDPHRVALEAYPGLLAREVLGRRSYKSDDKAKQTPDRLIARKDLLAALEAGSTRLGLRLRLGHALHGALVADAKGDALDAVLCMVQATWAWQQHQAGHPCYGLPPFDPLEGWIVSA
ncbi:MAG: hypothetical protein RJA09_1788 [Pseudomonadota bacterium]